MKALPLVLSICLTAAPALASDDPLQPVIDGCIDALAKDGGASKPGGIVIDTMFSEAGSMIYLEDADGRIWQCFGYKDGTVQTLELASEADAQAARDRAAQTAAMAPERIAFAPGTSGATLTRTLDAGGAMDFVLGAQAGQTMTLRVETGGGQAYYIIRNPDGSILAPGTDVVTPFTGPLAQSGDQGVEVVSKQSAPLTFDLVIEIR